MALVLLNQTGQCLGQFDGYDALTSTMLGGECAQLVPYAVTGTDKHAKDIEDGYSVSGTPLTQQVRPIATTTFAGGAGEGPFYLTDDGTTNYGTLFGSLVGSNSGQTVTGGTALGPHTMAGSGKVTLWANPGLYGVTLDALDATLVASTNIPCGTALFYTAAGKICLTAQKVSGGNAVAHFVEFETNGSLVTSNSAMTRVGIAGGVKAFKMAVINWNPPFITV